jgi:MacB-like protein
MLSRGSSANFSYPDFQDLQARGRLLSGLTASFPMESDLEVDGVGEFVAAEVVAANYGAVLGVAPALGRWFTSETEPVAVISHAVWQSRFGESASVLGRSIGSEAQSYTAGTRINAATRAGRTTGTRRHEIPLDASAADREPRAGHRRRRERPPVGHVDDRRS